MRTSPRILLLLALLLPGAAAAQQAMPLPQLWTGRVVLAEGVKPGLTGDRFELRVARLSSDHEISGLLERLRMGGQAGLRDAMRALPGKGFLSLGKLAATEVTVIRVADLDNGRRRVRVWCDFAIRLYDDSEPRGSLAHPFGFIELEVDASGEGGTGQLVAAASLAIGEDGLRIETAETPVMQVVEVTSDSPPPARAGR